MRIRVLIGLLVLLTQADAVAPQERLTLTELLSVALQVNPEILAAQKRYEASRQRPSQESSLPDPMLSVGYRSIGSPRPVAGLGTEPMSNAGLMLSQEFPFPGKRKLRGDIAGKEAEADFQQYQSVELEVISRVKQAFHRLHHTYEMIEEIFWKGGSSGE